MLYISQIPREGRESFLGVSLSGMTIPFRIDHFIHAKDYKEQFLIPGLCTVTGQ